MTEREYLPLIPPNELKQVRALLKSVAARRRLPAPSPAVDMDAAWARLLAAARTPVGGSWDDFFGPDDLEDGRLRKLAAALDEQLLGGCLRRAAAQSGAPALSFVVEDSTDGKADWISHYAEPNTIHLLRRKWRQPVSAEAPMVCESVLCATRLELLAHTLAHEMVHALVLLLWPRIDAASPAYLPDERHGPIFKLLNRRLFGHASDSYRHVFKPDVGAPDRAAALGDCQLPFVAAWGAPAE